MKNHYRIVALADLHIGGQRWGVDADTWARPMREAADFAVRQRPDVIVVAGDLFHKRSPSPDEYRHALDILCSPGLPLLIIDGNHDVGATKGTLSANWPFHLAAVPLTYTASGPATSVMWNPGTGWSPHGGPGLQFVTLPWPRLVDYGNAIGDDVSLEQRIAAARADCLALLKQHSGGLDARWPWALVGHAMLSYGGQGDPRDPGLLLGKDIVLPTSELPQMDAYLFGHVHQADKWYLGSSQPTDFADTGPKSFSVFDLTQQDDGTWKSERTPVSYATSLKVWDCVVSINDTTRTKHELFDAYRIECQRRALEAPRFDVARVRIAAGGVESPDPGRVRQFMGDYADRVVSVEVVKPPAVARRLGEDGPVIATLSPDAALEVWLSATGKAADTAFRERVLAGFRSLHSTEPLGIPQ